MLRKEVAWILYIITEIWMQTTFNVRTQTAEHSYRVHRLDTFWAWINAVQWQKVLFVMSVLSNSCKWSAPITGLETAKTATAADCCPEKLQKELTQSQCSCRPLSKLHSADPAKALMLDSSFSGWLSLQHWGTDLCTCHFSWKQW